MSIFIIISLSLIIMCLLYYIWKSKSITDIQIFEKLGKSMYIRNGVGFGFISDQWLYDNAYIEIGIGSITSGYGDWGGGMTHASDHALKIIIDRDFIIKKVKTSSFYNSKNSQEVERKAEKFLKRLTVGKKFIIKDEIAKHHVTEILKAIPRKQHIGHNVFEHPHMLEGYIDPKEANYYHKFPDAKCLIKEKSDGDKIPD